MSSPSLNKLYSEILVSKNRLSILRSYYTGIKDSIVAKLTDLYNDLLSDVSWVDRKISDLAVDKSDALTTMAKFVSNTEDSLIVNHDKYLEMMANYNSHIKDFYNRMTALYSTYEQNFNSNEITNISKSWKFHYTTNYSDAQPVEHSFGPLNITSESDVFELSNNRFIYMTNENVVYDVDYINREVYLVTIDSKTFANQFNKSQGSKKNYYGNERATFNSLFKLKNKSTVYAFVNVGSAFVQEDINNIGNSSDRAAAVIGLPTDVSPIQRLVICEYDYDNHKFNILTNNTSELFVRGDVLKNNKIHVVNGTSRDSYYFYIGRFFGRFKVSGENNTNVISRLMGTSNFNIKCAILDNDGYFTIPISETALAVYNSSGDSIDFSNPTIRTFDFASYQSQFASGEEGKIQALFYSTDIGGRGVSAIYTVTDKSIWYTTDRFNTVTKDTRTNSIAIINLSFTNPNEYLIDDFGYIYVLGDNARLYCAKTTDGISLQDTVVESPTRYADKIMDISSLSSTNLSGYLYSIDPDITKYQLSDAGGESFIHTYTKDDYDYSYDSHGVLISTVFKNSTYYGVTTTGKVVCFDIDAEGSSNATRKHLWTKQSICGNKEITSFIYDEDTEMFYFATSDYVVYYIEKDKLESQSVYVAHSLGTARIGSRITAMCKIGDDLYIGCNSGEIHCYSLFENSNGIIEGTLHTTSLNLDGYVEADKDLYCINDGKAIGNEAITSIINTGSVFVVCGKYGRVASCAINTHIWTNYKGEALNADTIDSNIYDNGEALNGRDITCVVNYMNLKLIVFGEGGYISSCNLNTGSWSKYDGTTINHGQTGFGPGIFNNGTILGGLNVKSCVRIGTTLFAGGEHGRMASINITTGGITEYRGTTPENNSEISGPGYNYTGSDLASLDDITSLTIDTYSGIVIMSGTSSFILSYSPSANEVLTPKIDKLYYVARRQSDYDYLSSLLVRVTKGSLNEYAPLYPPEENEDSNYKMAYEFSYYVYQNGKYVWRISTGFDRIYYSNDYGVTYTSKEIGNTNILPEILTNTIKFMAMGSVSSDGTFVFVNNIAGDSYFVYGTHDDSDFNANWIKSDIIFTQNEINTLMCVDNGTKYSFTMKIQNVLSTLIFNETSYERKTIPGSIAKVIDEKGNEYEYTFAGKMYMNGIEKFDIGNVLNAYIANFFKVLSDVHCVGMYYTKGNNFTFVVLIKNGDTLGSSVNLITFNFVNIDEGLVEDNYSISCKTLSLNELRLENAKNNFTEDYDNDITRFDVDENSVYLLTSFDGLKGFLGFNISLNNNYTNTDNRHVLISLHGDVYGTNYINDSAVYTIGDSAARMFCYDMTKTEIQLAHYNTLDNNGIIKHVNSIQIYKEIDADRHTPIRALTDAWKSCEINATPNGINAFAIRLKMINTEDVSENDAIVSNYTLRYQVLISDVTNGKYILYETEKSTGISKTDDETKVVEPFIRVIAIDGFEDEIMELYTSRRDSTRRHYFVKEDISSGSKFVGGFKSKIETTYDFNTYVQLRRSMSEGVNDSVKYQIKIKPLNTLPSNVDAEFFIEGYNNTLLSLTNDSSVEILETPIASHVGVRRTYSDINKAKFNKVIISSDNNDSNGWCIFGIPGKDALLTKSQMDIGHMTKKPYVSNINYYPQYDERESDISYGCADTFVNIIRGEGNGLFDKFTGIISQPNDDSSEWKFIPYSINKEDIKFVFDDVGSSIIKSNMDTKLLKNGRNLFKMKNFSVFSKGVINDADYYSDVESGRIAKVEGTMINPNGLFEVISSIDGHQKRINKVSEFKDGSIWRTISNSYEYIKERIYGKSYDFIDRFSVFDDPYSLINSWWVPAQGHIKHGNERLLSLGFAETYADRGIVGRKYLPHDNIESAEIVESSYSGDMSKVINGVVGNNTQAQNTSGSRTVAIKELEDEKFPLERWAGFEWADLDFIRKWRITYTDDTVEYQYEIEGPRIHNPSDLANPTLGEIYTLNHIPIIGSTVYNNIPALIRNPQPSIPRNLYSYKDDFDWEGRGTQEFKCATAYYYTSHNWKIYHVEIKRDTYDWTSEQYTIAEEKGVCKTFFDEETGVYLETPLEEESESKLAIVEDNNFARQNRISSEVIEDSWYVPETNNVNISALNHNNSKYYTQSYPIVAEGKPQYRNDLGLLEFDAFPRDVDSIVGEKIENLYIPVADMVYDINTTQPYKPLNPKLPNVDTGTIDLKAYHRGVVLINKEHFNWNWGVNGEYDAKKIGMFNKRYNNLLNVQHDFVSSEAIHFRGFEYRQPSSSGNRMFDTYERGFYIKGQNKQLSIYFGQSLMNDQIGQYEDDYIEGHTKYNYYGPDSQYYNSVVSDSIARDGNYKYYVHSRYYDDPRLYGMTGYNNPFGGRWYAQKGYYDNSSNICRTSDDGTGMILSNNSQSSLYGITDKDFILVYKSYYAKADENINNGEFGIKTITSDPTLNKISITTFEPVYDGYAGGGSGGYIYGKKKTVNVNLIYTYNNATDTNGKFNYIEGERVNSSYTNDYYEYSVHRPSSPENLIAFNRYDTDRNDEPYISNRLVDEEAPISLNDVINNFGRISNSIEEYKAYDDEENYTIVNGGWIHDSLRYITSRHRPPKDIPSSEVVDKLLAYQNQPLTKVPNDFEITDPNEESVLDKTYKFIGFKNDGTTTVLSENYKNKYRWIYLDLAGYDETQNVVDSDGDPILIATDASGDNINNYRLNCVEMYQWEDYSIVAHKTQHTIQDLIDNWGILVSVHEGTGVTVENNGSAYTIAVNLDVSGRDIDRLQYSGELRSVNFTSLSEVEYTEDENTIGNADSTRVTRWATDETVNGNGVLDGSNTEAVVVYELTNMTASNMANARYYEPYETTLTANAGGYSVPSDIAIYLGDTEDFITPDKYTYIVSPDGKSAELTIKSGVINATRVKIHGIAL